MWRKWGKTEWIWSKLMWVPMMFIHLHTIDSSEMCNKHSPTVHYKPVCVAFKSMFWFWSFYISLFFESMHHKSLKTNCKYKNNNAKEFESCISIFICQCNLYFCSNFALPVGAIQNDFFDSTRNVQSTSCSSECNGLS